LAAEVDATPHDVACPCYCQPVWLHCMQMREHFGVSVQSRPVIHTEHGHRPTHEGRSAPWSSSLAAMLAGLTLALSDVIGIEVLSVAPTIGWPASSCTVPTEATPIWRTLLALSLHW
jgi:hypothetical protein